jgi:4'-phosphopantetheinyl transferase
MNATSVWLSAPAPLKLETDEVHVWRARLQGRGSELDALDRLLSPDERARADRFHFPKDREQFIVARGTLRRLLSRYLSVEPVQVGFEYTSHGKPYLPLEAGGDTLRFNVSHSGGLALYAVTRRREVGVDIEMIRPEVAGEPLAERFFAPAEVAALRTLPSPQQPEAFFACWTRKEAYIKARGEGLSLPLSAFEVTLRPGEPAALCSTKTDPGEAARWALTALDPGPGFAAALAVEGHGWQLRCWEWSHDGG